jgi:hypothetical protein
MNARSNLRENTVAFHYDVGHFQYDVGHSFSPFFASTAKRGRAAYVVLQILRPAVICAAMREFSWDY